METMTRTAPAGAPAPAHDDATAFVARHQAETWRYLRLLGADPALAEELAQDALVRGWQHGLAGRPPAMAAAWLRTSARRLLASHHRTTNRRDADRLPFEDVEPAAVDAVWAATLGRGETYLDALDACVAGLEPRARTALDLRYRDGASRDAMAAALDVTEAGVKQLLRRTRARLRACIERRLG